MSRATDAESSIGERLISLGPRRLADWLNPTGTRKVHSLVDKVYKKKNLELAWKIVKLNDGVGGVDKLSLQDFEQNLQENLQRLHEELKRNTYKPQPVLQHKIPKVGQPEQFRKLGIPTVYDRVCQQALQNHLEPIFERVFDESSFGYRKGRSTKDALSKVWKEIQSGKEWIVDADLADFFGSADHEKVMTLISQQISDSRVLSIIKSMLKGGCMTEDGFVPAETGVVQGGVISPLISNVLLTPFDKKMRKRGYNLTRYADDWVVTCKTKAEAEEVLNEATKVLIKLGVKVHPTKSQVLNFSALKSNEGLAGLNCLVKRSKAIRHKVCYMHIQRIHPFNVSNTRLEQGQRERQELAQCN